MYIINIRHTDSHIIEFYKKRITLTIHKHLQFTLRVEKTCNKGLQS